MRKTLSTVMLAWALWWVQELVHKPEMPLDIVKLSVHDTQEAGGGLVDEHAARFVSEHKKNPSAARFVFFSILSAAVPGPTPGR